MLADLRSGFRLLARSPWFSLVVVLALGLGIGANTAMFTLANAVLFRGLPFDNPEEIMFLSATNRKAGQRELRLSYPEFQAVSRNTTAFQSLAAFELDRPNLADRASTPENYFAARLTANALPITGVQPVLGRGFRPDDSQAGAPAVVLLAHHVWLARYGARPSILGETIRINEVPHSVIGVMPEGFRFQVRQDLWLPIVPGPDLEKRNHRVYSVFGRLAPDAAPQAGQAEADRIAAQLAKEFPADNAQIGFNVRPYNDVFNGGEIRTLFLSLLGAVGFVLLIVCANVANLLMARSLRRVREISIRAALGAGRGRIVRQMLVESGMLGLAGGVLGLGVASAGVRAFDRAVANVNKPYWIDFSLDLTVFSYLAAVCLAAGIASGIFPAWQASKLDLNRALKEGGRGSTGQGRVRWITSGLVVAQLALTVVLLAGAGLLVRNFLEQTAMTAGYPADRMLTMDVNLPAAKYKELDARIRFMDAAVERLGGMPSVVQAAAVSSLPVRGSSRWVFEVEGAPAPDAENAPRVDGIIATQNYFGITGIKLLTGRLFTDADGAPGHEVTVVNHLFANRHWPNGTALGKRVRLIKGGKPQPWLTVIGVVPAVRQRFNAAELAPGLYVPYRQDPAPDMNFIALTTGPAGPLADTARRAIQTIDADLPVARVQTLTDVFREAVWGFRIFGTMFSMFAAFALLLASMGLYAVMAYSVSQRVQEFGVRIALGATRADILRQATRDGAWQLGLGLVLGTAGAFGITRVLSGILVQVSPTDPLVFSTGIGTLLLAGLCACLVPARAATRVDPVTALRYE